jgi:predicted Fe-Mo cluster-binding NifX family protein
MKVCFPLMSNYGLESPVFGHFGSAPLFMVVDIETLEVTEISNQDIHHAHGSCSPLQARGGRQVEAIVVGGIGAGALMGLNRSGLKVYQAQGASIAENLAWMAQVELPELKPVQACGGYGHGCGHQPI